MTSVVQPWLSEIPIRMQSTLLLGLRGPDTHACPGVKAIGRWLRGLTFKPGNPANVREFMGAQPPRIMEKDSVAKELEFASWHYVSHLMHALQVVAYRHPVREVSRHAFLLCEDICQLMHLHMEDSDTFEIRLGTVEWPGGVQPDDFDDALRMLIPPSQTEGEPPKGSK